MSFWAAGNVIACGAAERREYTQLSLSPADRPFDQNLGSEPLPCMPMFKIESTQTGTSSPSFLDHGGNWKAMGPFTLARLLISNYLWFVLSSLMTGRLAGSLNNKHRDNSSSLWRHHYQFKKRSEVLYRHVLNKVVWIERSGRNLVHYYRSCSFFFLYRTTSITVIKGSIRSSWIIQPSMNDQSVDGTEASGIKNRMSLPQKVYFTILP